MSRRKRELRDVYTKFDALKAGDKKVNVIGVVSAVNGSLPVPSKTKTAQYSCSFELVDESGSKIVCTIPDCSKEHLPKALYCGDILGLKGVDMELSEGKLSVRTSSNTAWTLFKKQQGFKPSTSLALATVGAPEKRRLTDLKDWLAVEAGELSRALQQQDISGRPSKRRRLDSHSEPKLSPTPHDHSQSVSPPCSPSPAHHPSPSPTVSHLSPTSPAYHLSPSPTVSHLPTYHHSPTPTASHLSPPSPAHHLSPSPTASHLSPPSPAHYVSPSPTASHHSPPPTASCLSPRHTPLFLSPRQSSPATPLAPPVTTTAPLSPPAPMNSSTSSVSKPLKDRYYDLPIKKISELVVGKGNAATMGILKYFKPPTKSSGKDHYSVLCLIDESNHSSCGMACIVFNPCKQRLPVPCAPGDVVIVKGLAISIFQGNLQGRGHENSLIGIFSTNPVAPIPDMIGNWYTMKPQEKVRVQELRSWVASNQVLLLNSKISELSVGNYCNTVCQVTRVSVNQHGTMVLSVCDGTTPKCPLVDPTHLTALTSIPSQEQASAVTVCTVFRPHVVAGDVVQLVNLCMVPSGRYACAGVELMQLVVRDHTHYTGAVNVLPGDSEVARKFRRVLPEPEPTLIPTSQPSPTLNAPMVMDSPSTNAGQLSTLIDCADARHATLREIHQAPVGSVLVAEVQVVGVGKDICHKLEDICQLRCSGCKSLYMTPRPQDPDFSRLLTAGDVCVCCSTDDLLEPNRLEYMYAFTLIIADNTAQMELAVAGAEGLKFFSQLSLQPTNLYVEAESRHSHWNVLHRMAGGQGLFDGHPVEATPHQPSLNLCIAVYLSSSNRRMYKILNTKLCCL